ncbi:hypothetical protein IMSAG025_00128 [Muribaculaceae bacterium]|nr:hypothetical protein IMSAG025_00128 [Muribaculaceae bacterium]
MPIQSEAALEEGLIAALQKMSYEYVQIKEETNLKENFYGHENEACTNNVTNALIYR